MTKSPWGLTSPQGGHLGAAGLKAPQLFGSGHLFGRNAQVVVLSCPPLCLQCSEQSRNGFRAKGRRSTEIPNGGSALHTAPAVWAPGQIRSFWRTGWISTNKVKIKSKTIDNPVQMSLYQFRWLQYVSRCFRSPSSPGIRNSSSRLWTFSTWRITKPFSAKAVGSAEISMLTSFIGFHRSVACKT